MPLSARVLFTLAWPIVLSRATQAVIGFTDALFVAPLGEEALAAATTGAFNTFAAIILPMGTVFIVQSFAAQLRGRGQLDAVRRYAVYGLSVALGGGLAAALLIPLVPRLLGLLDYAPAVRSSMITYLSIRLWSVAPAVASEALGNWYGGLGNTRLAMRASVVAMLANVLGDYALIEPRFGLPGYGVAGAAYASVAATLLGFAVLLVAFLRQQGHSLPPARLGFRFAEFWRVLRFGLPNGVNWFLEFAAFMVYINVVVGHMGTSALAAFNVVMQINGLSFMPAFGVASAGAILVGEAIGARRHERVWPIVRLTGSVAGLWMGGVGLIYLCAPRALIGLFVARGAGAEGLFTIGVTMLGIAAFWQLFDALSLTLSETLRAAGDTTWCLWARIIVAWLLFTPLAWAAVLWLHGGVVTLMVSLVIYVATLAGALSFRFASGRWREIDLVGEPAPP